MLNFKVVFLFAFLVTLQIAYTYADEEDDGEEVVDGSVSRTGNPADCEDRDPECPGMAAGGDCMSNTRFMFNNCRKSCNLCNCVDEDSRKCRGAAAVGKCKKKEYKEQMISECPQSCHQCRTSWGRVVI